MKEDIAKNRIEVVDYIRGWAILGIILVNIFGLSTSDVIREDFLQYWRTLPFEKTILFLRANILDNRIFPILSLLFGWGIGIQLKKYPNTLAIYKRLLVLLIIGILHAFFLWWGDVLILYSICGFFVLIIKDWSNRSIQLLLAGIVFFPFYRHFQDLFNISFYQNYFNLNDLNRNELIATLKNGGSITFLKVNLIEWLNTNIRSTPFFLPKQLIMALVGLMASRKDNLFNIIAHQSANKWLFPILVVLLLFRTAGYTFLTSGITQPFLSYSLEVAIRIVELSTSTIFLLLIYKLYNSSFQLGIKKLVVAVGKMSLSNYLTHSIIGLLLFHVFDYYGMFLPSTLLIIALVMFISSGIASLLWLKRNSSGPMELIWRKLAYK